MDSLEESIDHLEGVQSHYNPEWTIYNDLNIALSLLRTHAERDKQFMETYKKLKEDNEILTAALHPIKSPCGHSGQYAYTEDGGKHIVCLVCVKEENERLKEELRQIKCNICALTFDNDICKDCECFKPKSTQFSLVDGKPRKQALGQEG